MLREIGLLTRLESLNLYGLNRFRHTTDKKEKRRIVLLSVAWAFVILMVAGYTGGYAYALCYLGLKDAICALFTVVISLIILFFGIFSSAPTLFRKNGVEVLSALPVRPFSIAASRLIRMYIENVLLCALVTLPAIGVFVYFARPSVLFYLAWLISVIFMPVIPMCLSLLPGALISMVSAMFKRKAIFQTALTVLFIGFIFWGSASLTRIEDELTLERIKSLTETMLNAVKGVYPPAAWIGGIAQGAYEGVFALIGVSLGLLGITLFVVARVFPFVVISQGARGSAKAFRAEKSVKASLLLPALINREFRRYFASGIYMMNTFISPIMTLAAAVMLSIGDVQTAVSALPVDLNLPLIAAFLLGIISSLMPPSAVSLSMEGKTWWLLKTLPITNRHLFGAKILMSVLLNAPFLLIASILTAISLAPDAVSAVIMLIAPILINIFACTWALFINTKFPRFDWENEVYVVKQSAAAGIGGLTAPLIGIVSMIPVLVYGTIWAAAIALFALGTITYILLKVIFKVSPEKL
ncbi:MAG: hypothetical protein E7322_02430 [Clostridiales bacterium]|nr:hypothetical protein [Clostridiales bacterium]